jgi:hypothetical protein
LKSIALITITIVLLCSCEWFGPAEKSKTESERTTYRSADESSANPDEVRPIAQKIPGESKKN